MYFISNIHINLVHSAEIILGILLNIYKFWICYKIMYLHMCKNEILSMGNKVNSCKGHACKESNERKYTQHTTYTCMKTALSNRIQYT